MHCDKRNSSPCFLPGSLLHPYTFMKGAYLSWACDLKVDINWTETAGKGEFSKQTFVWFVRIQTRHQHVSVGSFSDQSESEKEFKTGLCICLSPTVCILAVPH